MCYIRMTGKITDSYAINWIFPSATVGFHWENLICHFLLRFFFRFSLVHFLLVKCTVSVRFFFFFAFLFNRSTVFSFAVLREYYFLFPSSVYNIICTYTFLNEYRENFHQDSGKIIEPIFYT